MKKFVLLFREGVQVQKLLLFKPQRARFIEINEFNDEHSAKLGPGKGKGRPGSV